MNRARRHVLWFTPAVVVLTLAAHGQDHVRFAWFTDTHVGSETGEADLQAAIDDVNSRADLEFVLLSGDVTEMGTDEQLDRAARALGRLRIPFHGIPGNHDTKWSPSGGTCFPRLFGSDRFDFTHCGVRFIGIHQGPRMRMADGHWAPEDLRWLDSVLAAGSPRPIVFVTHYPVDSSICNWFEALDRLRGTLVQVALVGHGHTNARLDFEGIPGVMGRAVLRGRSVPAGYTIVDVSPDSIRCSEVRLGEAAPYPWTAVARSREVYRGTGGPRPSFAVNRAYATVRQTWAVHTGYTIASRPAVSGTECIVGTTGGDVRALSLSDGSTRWSFMTGGPVFSSPDTGMGLVVFGSTDGCVYALEAATGRQRWCLRTGRPVVGAPAIHGGVVYIGGSDGFLRAIKLSDGKPCWRSDSVGGFIEARPAVGESLVVVGAWDGFLYAFDRRDGKMRWKWQGDRAGSLFAPAACTPVIVGNDVFVVAPDRAMTRLDLRNGSQLWRSRRHQVRESLGGGGHLLLVRTMRDSIIALEPESLTERWSTHVGFGYDLNPAPPVLVGSTIVYGTMKGLFVALDAVSGAVRWIHRTGVSLVNPVVPLDEQRFLIADMDGVVQIITVGEEQ